MKYIIITVSLLLLLKCAFSKESRASNKIIAEIVETNQANEKTDSVQNNAQVALDFLNSYISYQNKIPKAIGRCAWVNKSTIVTDNFKTELKNLIDKAEKENPGYGLGFDPIFDAQDYPDEGVELFEYNHETGYLIVRGINWKSYKVTMKIVSQNNKTVVDGCGVINIPKEKQTNK